MIPFTGKKHAHSDTSNVDDERKMRRVDASKMYGCVCVHLVTEKTSCNVIV